MASLKNDQNRPLELASKTGHHGPNKPAARRFMTKLDHALQASVVSLDFDMLRVRPVTHLQNVRSYLATFRNTEPSTSSNGGHHFFPVSPGRVTSCQSCGDRHRQGLHRSRHQHPLRKTNPASELFTSPASELFTSPAKTAAQKLHCLWQCVLHALKAPWNGQSCDQIVVRCLTHLMQL